MFKNSYKIGVKLNTNLILKNTTSLTYLPKCSITTSNPLLARSSDKQNQSNSIDVDWERDGREFEFNFNDHTTPAHRFIRQIRYVRHYLRKAKFELPKLKDLRKDFTPPASQQYIQFSRIEHLGEEHPLDIKSIMVIDMEKLKGAKIFNEEEMHKLLLICSQHYFQESNQLRFSSKKYPTFLENKLNLIQLWNRIIKEVKEGEDKFLDIPLPTFKPNSSHRRLSKEQINFPTEWIKN
ncbi:hypothetical protein K502DRAFT_340517 [Neoconidiobolus thromboides FSU 785]|nr:hypothetical protein K502DRAFT_340517 [Neoconidiobolus thromboides FSU 785]